MGAKYPSEVYVGGKWYTLKDKTLEMQGDGHMGETHVEKCEIHLNSQQHIQQLRDTVLHELMHAVFNYTGLTHEIKEDDVPNPNEETLIQRLAPAILALLRENPDLVKYLTRK